MHALDFGACDNGPVAAPVDAPMLEAGERYLAVAIGFPGDAGFLVLPAIDALSLTGVYPWTAWEVFSN